jgi:hypothetical protein
MGARISILEVFFIDLQVPDVDAIAAAVGDHVARLPAKFRRFSRHALARPTAVDADDGVGHRHLSTVTQTGPEGASRG